MVDPPGVVCVGEAIWDLRAPPGVALERAGRLRRRPGGGAVNTALALAGIGVRTGLCAALGDDPLGRGLRDEVEAAGVDAGRVALGGCRTGVAFVAVREGEARFVGYRQPREELRALVEALPARWGARVLHLSGVTPVRGSIGAIARAIARARGEEGCAISVDVNARPRLWAGAGATLQAVLRHADLVKCSAPDLAAIGCAPSDLRARLRPAALLVITDGGAPARIVGPSGEIAIAPRRTRAVEPMGAGDAFCAGMLAELAGEDRAAWAHEALARRAVARGHAVARAWILGRG